MDDVAPLRKHLALDSLVEQADEIADPDFWRGLLPGQSVTSGRAPDGGPGRDRPEAETAAYLEQLREEGYFQTPPLLPAGVVRGMRACVEGVRAHGFPATFALVYDVFYDALAHLGPVLRGVLGPGYRLVPNVWVYDVAPAEEGKGFEPHRDAEYLGTLGPDGTPRVVTLWVTVTDATPLNSCMYLLPKHRDPEYEAATRDLSTGATRFALEDVRALPTPAGTLSCWDQYVFHWGSRASRRARGPRISVALYGQRGDVAPVEPALLDPAAAVPFEARLAIVCKGLYRYSQLSVEPGARDGALADLLERHMAALPAA